MSLIHAYVLAKYLSVATEQPGLQQAIDVGTARVKAALGLTSIDQVKGNTHTVKPSIDTHSILMPHGPVTALEGITVDGAAQDLNDWTFTYWRAMRPLEALSRDSTIVVTYTIGWANEATLPTDLRAAILMVAAATFGRTDPTINAASTSSERTNYDDAALIENILQVGSAYRPYTG